MAPTLDIDKVLSELSLPEKVKLLTGDVSLVAEDGIRAWADDVRAGQGLWHTVAYPEKGVPAVRMTDGAR